MQYAAASAVLRSGQDPRLYPHFASSVFGLAAMTAAHKNSSIADLRLKAKQHAEAIASAAQSTAVGTGTVSSPSPSPPVTADIKPNDSTAETA